MTIEEILLREIDRAPSLLSVSKATGLRYGNLHRFYNQGADIRLSSVQALADHFGYRLVKRKSQVSRRKR